MCLLNRRKQHALFSQQSLDVAIANSIQELHAFLPASHTLVEEEISLLEAT